jgi:hypothetical protein
MPEWRPRRQSNDQADRTARVCAVAFAASGRYCPGEHRRKLREMATSPSVILNDLSFLAPDLFVEFGCGKNRIKNKCEQNYPASGRND